MKNIKISSLIIAVMVGFAFTSLPLFSAPVELIENGGFEKVENGKPVRWRNIHAGELTSSNDAHTGKRSLKYIAFDSKRGHGEFGMEEKPYPIRLKPGVTCQISFWAKGKGWMKPILAQVSPFGRGMFIGSEFLPEYTLTNEWKKHEYTFKPTDKRLGFVCPFFYLSSGGEMLLDDFSMTFDPEENPGVTLTEPSPEMKLKISITARDAEFKFFAGKVQIPVKDNLAVVTLSEGLTPLCLEATATGKNPRIKISIENHPETNGRWKVSSSSTATWRNTEFDDKKWSMVESDPDDFMWNSDKNTNQAFFRQVIIWNQNHYGPNRCLLPKMKALEFPKDAMEVLHLALYSPLSRPLDDYNFILEIPSQFELLDKFNYKRRWIMNNPAKKIVMERVKFVGKSFKRYVMSHPSSELLPDKTQWSLLPIRMIELPPEKNIEFRYHREANGNLTELTQTLPVKILPPINGRMPKKILVYYRSPTGYEYPPREKMHEMVAQDAKAGINACCMGLSSAWGEYWYKWRMNLYRDFRKNGMSLILPPSSDFPLNYGSNLKGHLPKYFQWLMNNPQAHCRYFNNNPAWGSKQSPYSKAYCNQYVLEKEGEAFWNVVEEEYRSLLKTAPDTIAIWIDWEFHHFKPDGTATHCFCDRCKKAFAKFAKIKNEDILSDETIVKKMRVQWQEFRDWQDGQIVQRIHKLCQKLGLPLIVYTGGSNDGFWKACENRIDLPFAAYPGNTPADSYTQKHMDNLAKKFAKWGYDKIIFQRFPFLTNTSKNGWLEQSRSWSGFLCARNWKTELLRMAATDHGGIDLSEGFARITCGIHYYIGEATRIISEFEELFYNGKRADNLASSEQIAYPNLLVLTKDNERLVLLFNESTETKTVTLVNKELLPGTFAQIYGLETTIKNSSEMKVNIPPEDVAIVHISYKKGFKK